MSSYDAAGEPIKLAVDLALAATTGQPQVPNSPDSQNDRLWNGGGRPASGAGIVAKLTVVGAGAAA